MLTERSVRVRMNPLAASTLWQLGSSWRKNALDHVCELREPIRNALDRRGEVFLTVSTLSNSGRMHVSQSICNHFAIPIHRRRAYFDGWPRLPASLLDLVRAAADPLGPELIPTPNFSYFVVPVRRVYPCSLEHGKAMKLW